ncbi:DUF4302 domain-containing protein [Pedobacter borealis]|uniref:DUF4302 domain-containing protein n=1 Tax=Pedobacter borealis TaxID=475254 RepID=UPI001428C7B0|nr:DUF4302 domain-containing protein [Pedobacter borealis]
MKRILYLFMICLAMASCKKDSFVSDFDQKPEERIAESIASVTNTLTSAPNGWIATLPTNAGGAYGFYMTFDANQNVTMYADLNDNTAKTLGKSTFRVKAVLGTELIFDTYNYISMLADPNNGVFGGAGNTGYKSDVEFTYSRATVDSIFFIGKAYRQTLAMVKATAAQKAAYTAEGLKTSSDRLKSFFATTQNPYIEVVSGSATIKAGLSVNFTNVLASGKRATLTGILADGTTVVSATNKIALTTDGISMTSTGLVFQGITLVKFAWKDATTLAMYDAAGKEYIIKSSPIPLTPLPLLFGFPSSYTYRKISIGGTSPVAGGALLPSGVTSQFNVIYQALVAKLAALTPARTIVGISFALTSNSTAVVNISPNNGTTTFSANATFNYSITDGVITLTNPVYDANWTARGTEYDGVKKFFLSGPFKIDWVTSINPSGGLLGGLYRTVDGSSFIYGTL